MLFISTLTQCEIFRGMNYNKSLLLITVRIDYSPSAALNILQICFNGITAGNFVLFG